MKRHGLTLLSVLFIVSLSISLIQAPPTDELPFTVDGIVTDHLGDPLNGVQIHISNLGTGESKYTSSSELGYYGAILMNGVSQGDIIRVVAQYGSDQKTIDHVLTEGEASSAGIVINVSFEESTQTTTPPPTTTPAPTERPTTPPPDTSSPPQTTIPPTPPQTTIPPELIISTTNPPTTQLPSETTLPPTLTKEPSNEPMTTSPPSTTTYAPPTGTPDPSGQDGDESGRDYAFYLALLAVLAFGIYVVNEIRK